MSVRFPTSAAPPETLLELSLDVVVVVVFGRIPAKRLRSHPEYDRFEPMEKNKYLHAAVRRWRGVEPLTLSPGENRLGMRVEATRRSTPGECLFRAQDAKPIAILESFFLKYDHIMKQYIPPYFPDSILARLRFSGEAFS